MIFKENLKIITLSIIDIVWNDKITSDNIQLAIQNSMEQIYKGDCEEIKELDEEEESSFIKSGETSERIYSDFKGGSKGNDFDDKGNYDFDGDFRGGSKGDNLEFCFSDKKREKKKKFEFFDKKKIENKKIFEIKEKKNFEKNEKRLKMKENCIKNSQKTLKIPKLDKNSVFLKKKIFEENEKTKKSKKQEKVVEEELDIFVFKSKKINSKSKSLSPKINSNLNSKNFTTI